MQKVLFTHSALFTCFPSLHLRTCFVALSPKRLAPLSPKRCFRNAFLMDCQNIDTQAPPSSNLMTSIRFTSSLERYYYHLSTRSHNFHNQNKLSLLICYSLHRWNAQFHHRLQTKFWVYKELVIYIFCDFSHKSHTMHLMDSMIMSEYSCYHYFK